MQKSPEPKKRSNLRDVAKAAGVSVATVSRVLNEPGVVKKDTLEKVQAAIARLKFVPSAALHDLIERTMLPTIITSFYDMEYPLPTIGYDNAGAAQLALLHLIDLGYRRIAVVHGPTHDNDRTRTRLSGLHARPMAAELTTFEADISHQGRFAPCPRSRTPFYACRT